MIKKIIKGCLYYGKKEIGSSQSLFWYTLVNIIAFSPFTPRILRYALYKGYGMKVSATSNFAHGCYFKTSLVTIGKGTFINHKCYFDNLAMVEIGEKCSIAMDVLFCTTSHEFGSNDKRAGRLISKSIKIGNGCWIGARANIMLGVTIGDGCVIASGAVVTKDCESNGLYAGVPARRIKDL